MGTLSLLVRNSKFFDSEIKKCDQAWRPMDRDYSISDSPLKLDESELYVLVAGAIYVQLELHDVITVMLILS